MKKKKNKSSWFFLIKIIAGVILWLCLLFYVMPPNFLKDKIQSIISEFQDDDGTGVADIVVLPQRQFVLTPEPTTLEKSFNNIESKENACFFVKFVIEQENGHGEIIFEINKTWAPLGAIRFKELVESSFFDGNKFFRVLKNFICQFGMNGDPAVQSSWSKKVIADDPVLHSNARGTLTFATSGKNSRTTQMFINTGRNNKFLDAEGFAPIGRIVKGLEIADALFEGYGEGGKGDGADKKGPAQGRIAREGNAYLEAVFPKLSTLLKAEIVN